MGRDLQGAADDLEVLNGCDGGDGMGKTRAGKRGSGLSHIGTDESDRGFLVMNAAAVDGAAGLAGAIGGREGGGAGQGAGLRLLACIMSLLEVRTEKMGLLLSLTVKHTDTRRC